MGTYQDYIAEQHYSKLKRNPYYIEKIPADEINYEMCRIALTSGAGDYKLFKLILGKYPNFIDKKLCEIAVSAEPKKEFLREEDSGYTQPNGTPYDPVSVYKYFDPVLKHIPEKFRTADICRASAKYDWRTLEFVPVAVQISHPDICELAIKNCREIMEDADDLYRSSRQQKILEFVNQSVFEHNPNIFKGEYTLKHVSTKWLMENLEKVSELLLKYPEQVKLLPKEFRKQHFEVIRNVAEKDQEIIRFLYIAEQKSLIDLCKKALQNGSLDLSSIPASIQVLIPDICVAKLTKDPYMRVWWANKPMPELNLENLCLELQMKNSKLISKLVSENGNLLKYVKTEVLIAHPEICDTALQKQDFDVFETIPQAVFDANPYLYKTVAKKQPKLLLNFPKKIQTRALWTEILNENPWMATMAPKGYTTIEHYKAAFSNGRYLSLSGVPNKFKTYEICKLAVIQNYFNLEMVPKQIKIDHPDICEVAIEQHPWCIKDVPEIVQLQNPNLCKMAISSNPETLEEIHASVQRKYPEICRLALAQLVVNWGPCFTRTFVNELEKRKKKLYDSIAPDVLKKHWEFINDIRGVITAVPHRGRF